jgi:sec-independent protein translocase protein TatA
MNQVNERERETMFGLNPWELGLIFLAIMLLFGAKRVPEIARSFGKGIREFKASVESKEDLDEKDADDKLAETADKS